MTVYELINGTWEPVEEPTRGGFTGPRRPELELPNYVIVCDYGDWSGFQTLADCLKQIPSSWPSKAPGFFRIEER